MRRLYRLYDAGGISGREPRSLILEWALALIPQNNIPEDVFLTENLLREARSREASAEHDEEIFWDLEHVSDTCYISLVAAELAKWYAQDPTVELSGGWYISLEEKNIFDAFARLLPVKENLEWYRRKSFEPSLKDLVEEGSRRVRARAEAELEKKQLVASMLVS